MAEGASAGVWQVSVDTGGTFTDCIARDPEGALHVAKVLSHSALRGTVGTRLDDTRLEVSVGWTAPRDLVQGFELRLLGRGTGERSTVVSHDPVAHVLEITAPLEGLEPGTPFELLSPEEAPLLAARLVTRTPSRQALPPLAMRLGTTRGTNALLERQGAPVVFFVTRGFGDLLRIGTQQRPDLFSLKVEKPEPLTDRVVEVAERVGADGTVREALNEEAIRADARRAREAGARVAAVALMNAYRNPVHEDALVRILGEVGFDHVSASSHLARRIQILPRAETAVVDATLTPIVLEFLERVSQGVHEDRLHVMTSAGGLVRSSSYRAKDSLLSGPAGGVVGAAAVARRSGLTRALAFDMGGTSTDVARFDGDYDYRFEHGVGEAHLLTPALAIESVAAGGGSLCGVGSTGVFVGPRSAGAHPGPACYGAGGPLTLTDVNLLLGRLVPDRFAIPVDVVAARNAVQAVVRRLEEETTERAEPDQLLEGFLEIANERMADPIRAASLRRGYDPADHALVAFGGAGGQHGCALAERLGMDTVLVPQGASLLSAEGLGAAVVERFEEREVLQALDQVEVSVPEWLHDLEERARSAVEAEGVAPENVVVRRRIAALRFVGQDATLSVEVGNESSLRHLFDEHYVEVFGHRPEGRRVELESLKVVASSRVPETPRPVATPEPREAVPTSRQRARFAGEWVDVPVYERSTLPLGAALDGPALIVEEHSTTVLEVGWTARVDHAGALVLRRAAAVRPRPAGGVSSRAVETELFTRRFEALVGEMGEQLRRTAVSTNVKEREDFSCALLDPEGLLVVNAPHIPVHLGSLGLCVRSLMDAVEMGPGDVVVTNHPRFGGSHLPDVTVVTPAHSDAGELLGYLASRAHHAELGGIRPGSMPPDAARLVDEGVVLLPEHIVRGGASRWEALRERLEAPPHPSRSPEDNLADLRAAVAANQRGKVALQELCAIHGPSRVREMMDALGDQASRSVARALEAMGHGEYAAVEHLDDGTPLQVRIRVGEGAVRVDFGGSGSVHPGSLNATPAIVRSVVLYVLRLLVREPLPLNEGLMKGVSLHVPEGILNPPFPDDPARAPAIVGGNVETSQRLVDTLIKAFGLGACSQGTMNNVTFGNASFGYYETVCGGCGGLSDAPGASAVHSHMTNTKITDPEILEHRYPVRVDRFEIRRGSGGAGRHRGGEGVIRELVFHDAVSLSVLTQHRREGPYGQAGGAPGQPGRQRVVRASGEEEELGSVDGREIRAGDRLILETPGGGGYGRAEGGGSS